jgi:DmsE family decaheme c-type cytochrome
VSPKRLLWSALGFALLGMYLFSSISCSGPRSMSAGRGETTNVRPYGVKPQLRFRELQLASVSAPLPVVADAEMIGDDELCMQCHEAYVKYHHSNVHRSVSCEECHGPGSQHVRTRGREPGMILSFKTLPSAQKSELCLKCHENDACSPGASWRTSPHANAGLSCTDCHTGHYNVPYGTPATELADARRPQVRLAQMTEDEEESEPEPDMNAIRAISSAMGAAGVNTCFRCHGDKAEATRVGHPHQICGAVGFSCTTCHDPHGQIIEETRTELCLTCHKGHPTASWQSSTHSQYGVACTDCHNPHPCTEVSPVVGIEHTNIRRPKRLPMAVDEPFVCYKCHQDTYAQFSLPSHHPVKEGKMVCSDCHDSHGQHEGNLNQPTLNMVCYRCHADKEGPFAYEHPPVTENCAICHNPHGTVANNMLHQPTTFLCLRCHTGHRTSPSGPNHAPLLGDVGNSPSLQRAFFTDCTQCHSQIHGSDVPSPHRPRVFMR